MNFNVYLELKLLITFLTLLKLVSVSITDDEATPTLGQCYVLTCSVFEANVTTYQWIKDEIIILNETSPTLSFQPLELSDAGLYTCDIDVNSTSDNSTVGITLRR